MRLVQWFEAMRLQRGLRLLRGVVFAILFEAIGIVALLIAYELVRAHASHG